MFPYCVLKGLFVGLNVGLCVFRERARFWPTGWQERNGSDVLANNLVLRAASTARPRLLLAPSAAKRWRNRLSTNHWTGRRPSSGMSGHLRPTATSAGPRPTFNPTDCWWGRAARSCWGGPHRGDDGWNLRWGPRMTTCGTRWRRRRKGMFLLQLTTRWRRHRWSFASMMFLVRTTHPTTPGAQAESDIHDPCSTKDSDGELVELKEVAGGGKDGSD